MISFNCFVNSAQLSKNNTEIKRNRAVTKFINDPNARERLRVHNEAKKARKVYAIGPSRRAAAEAGVLQSNSKESGLTRVKKVLFNKFMSSISEV